MSSNNVRVQNLRDFTVQVGHDDTEAIVGTGIVVSMDGQVVTCTHVVRAAGVEPQDADGGEVGVCFAQARGGEEGVRRAAEEVLMVLEQDQAGAADTPDRNCMQ